MQRQSLRLAAGSAGHAAAPRGADAIVMPRGRTLNSHNLEKLKVAMRRLSAIYSVQ